MLCAICRCPAPADHDLMIDRGWLPHFYAGQQELEGPVCPECRFRHLRLGPDGEWEVIVRAAIAYRYN